MELWRKLSRVEAGTRDERLRVMLKSPVGLSWRNPSSGAMDHRKNLIFLHLRGYAFRHFSGHILGTPLPHSPQLHFLNRTFQRQAWQHETSEDIFYTLKRNERSHQFIESTATTTDERLQRYWQATWNLQRKSLSDVQDIGFYCDGTKITLQHP